MTCDKMWVYYFTPESKQSSMGWCYTVSPPPKKFKTQLSVGKIIASVFWDSEGVSRVDFLPHVTTINAQYYSNLLCNNVPQTIWGKKKGALGSCQKRSCWMTMLIHVQQI
jgi:hypothetical protein